MKATTSANDPSLARLTTADGLTLACRRWVPAQMPVAALAVVHGVGEHSGRYERLGQHFSGRRFGVFAVDLRGHGRSEGQRGHVERFSDFHFDVRTLLDCARQETPDVPVFLLGHSLGGLIVLHYTLHYPDGLAAVVSSGAALRATIDPPAWKVALGKAMARLRPRLSLSTGLDARGLSHDQAVVAAYLADPLVHDQVTARFYTEYQAAAAWTMDAAPSLSVPALILCGGQDPVVDPAGSRDFFGRIGHEDRHFLEYPGLFHEIFNEPEFEAVFDDIEAWLTPRLQIDVKM